jgi:hypothetical protein
VYLVSIHLSGLDLSAGDRLAARIGDVAVDLGYGHLLGPGGWRRQKAGYRKGKQNSCRLAPKICKDPTTQHDISLEAKL